jgi:hypothetical protein
MMVFNDKDYDEYLLRCEVEELKELVSDGVV